MKYVDYDESKLQSFQITETAISNGKLLGTCELGTAEIQLLNDSNEYSNFKNKWIKTAQGSFFIYDVAPVQERINIKLSCYDIKYLLDTAYDKKDFEDIFPCKMVEWRNKMAEKLGITFNDNNLFPNSEYLLDSHPYIDEKSSYRDVFKQIAHANWIETDEDDNFYFGWIKDEEPIEIDDWLELTTEKEPTEPVNEVVLGRGDVDDIEIYPRPAPENAKELRIDNNYILDPQDTTTSSDRRREVIEAIYNQVNGLSYIPFTLRTQWCDNPFKVRLGSKVSYKDIWSNTLESIVMTRTLNWLGGDTNNPNNWEITISAEEIDETKSDYKLASPNDKINDLYIKADKTNKRIEAAVQEIDSTKESVSKIELDSENIKSAVSNVEKNVTTIENSVTNLQTSTYTKTEINTKLTDGSVTKVDTTSGTFDKDGMHYDKSGAPTASTINHLGVNVEDSTTREELLFAGYDEELKQTIVRTENLTVRKYFVIGQNSRLEDYEDGGGIFVL